MSFSLALRSANAVLSIGSKLEVSVACLSGGMYGACERRRLGPKSKSLKNPWIFMPLASSLCSAFVHNFSIKSTASLLYLKNYINEFFIIITFFNKYYFSNRKVKKINLKLHSAGTLRVCCQLITFVCVPSGVSSRNGGSPTSIS